MLCRWSSRLAIFSLVLLATTALMHRFLGLPTPTAFNLLAVCYATSALAFLAAVIASIPIWRFGAPGTSLVAFGGGLSLIMLLAPLPLAALASQYPTLNDITTDPADPPPFNTLASLRIGWANPATYPAQKFAALQARAYPDLAPLVVNRPLEETYDLAIEALKRLQYTIVSDREPTDGLSEGLAEAVDRTLILGFNDDIAIRVRGDGERAWLDIRSSSRYGRSDFGRNAGRVREILREMTARLEATVPAVEDGGSGEPGAEAGKVPKQKLKEGKGADREKGASRRKRDDARRASRREQERTEPPP